MTAVHVGQYTVLTRRQFNVCKAVNKVMGTMIYCFSVIRNNFKTWCTNWSLFMIIIKTFVCYIYKFWWITDRKIGRTYTCTFRFFHTESFEEGILFLDFTSNFFSFVIINDLIRRTHAWLWLCNVWKYVKWKIVRRCYERKFSYDIKEVLMYSQHKKWHD